MAGLTGDEQRRCEATRKGLYFLREAAAFEARRSNRIVRSIDCAVGVLTVLATAVGAWGIAFGVSTRPLAWMEAACGAALVLLASRTTRERARESWIRHRFFAEFSRALLQCVPVGIGPRTLVEEASSALPAEGDPSMVFLQTLEAALAEVEAPATPSASPDYAVRVSEFIDDQIKHHAAAEKRRRVAALATKQVGVACFVGATAVTLIAALSSSGIVSVDVGTLRTMQFASIVLPVVAASTFLWGVQREYLRMSKRSGRMVRVLRGLNAELAKATDDAGRAEVIARIARAHALESYEWSTLMEMAE